MIVFLFACDDPPVLSRVADGFGAEVRDEAEPAIGAFVSAGALIVEACGSDEVDNYTFSGEGSRAFRISTAAVVVNETSGQRTWDFGDVAVGEDMGNLTITTDEGRTAYNVSFSGIDTVMTASFTLLACEAGDATVATQASVSGNGDFTKGERTAELSIGAATTTQAIEWEPANAPVPASGWVHWKGEDTSLLLDPAGDIDLDSRLWPGLAEGEEGWESKVSVLLP